MTQEDSFCCFRAIHGAKTEGGTEVTQLNALWKLHTDMPGLVRAELQMVREGLDNMVIVSANAARIEVSTLF